MVHVAVVGLYVATAVQGALLAYAWRRRDQPGATSFIALLSTIFVWTAGYTVAIQIPTDQVGLRLFLRRIEWLGISVLPTAWLVFTLDYAGYDRWLTRRTVAAMLVIPAATLAISWLQPALMWETTNIVDIQGLSITANVFGDWYWVNLAWAYGTFLGGSALLLWLVVSAEFLYTDQIVSLVVGGVVAWVGNIVSNFTLLPIPMDYTPYAFTVTAVLFGHAIFRYDLLDSVPASLRSGRAAIIEEMDDGVLVLDRNRRIIDANPVAATALGTDTEAVVGQPVEALLDLDVAHLEGGDTQTVASADEGRQYEVRATRTSDRFGREMGWILVFRDVTLRRAYEQRLSVVNRVLRHNLRNDMSTVIGNAEHIEELAREREAYNGEVASAAARIRSTAHQLTTTAEKARAIEVALEDHPSHEEIDLSAAVEGVCDWARETYPNARVEVDVPPDVRVSALDALDVVLQVLVENGIEHNDSVPPRVSVDADVTGESVSVHIVDNGEDIPMEEIAVLAEGAETELKHGSGLGLWLAHWIVEASDGELMFSNRDEGGSVVTVRLPLAEQRAEADS